MIKKLFFVLYILSAINAVKAQKDTIKPINELIEYTGRIDFSDPDAPTFSYSGVSIRANFTGTLISMIMDDNTGQNYYNLILDGKLLDTVLITRGIKSYLIADGLEDGEHEIEVFKRTELTFGKTTFLGFIVGEGQTLLPVKHRRTKFIEYIGNSITCGYGNEGPLGEQFCAETENHYLTYAAIISRNFNARHMAVSRSGIGIYRNYNGPFEGNPDCMANYYTRIFLYDENPKYEFSAKPDLVCINLGTNDFSTTGADSALYVSNYFRLLDTIQSKYNGPEIICLLGPMMSGESLNKVRGYLKFIADSAGSTGKGKVHFFEMSAQNGDLGIGVDYHPTVAQHQKNADELTEFIRTIKGWNIQPLLVKAEVLTPFQVRLEFNTGLVDPENGFGGFTVRKGHVAIPVNTVLQDTEQKNILNITLNDDMVPGETIHVQYKPGTIRSINSELLLNVNVDVESNIELSDHME